MILVYIIFGALATAAFSYLLDFTFWEGNIFQNWLPFIEKKVGKFWYKPLGGCATCANVWHSIFSFWVVVWYFNIPIDVKIIPLYISFIVISNLILRKINTDG